METYATGGGDTGMIGLLVFLFFLAAVVVIVGIPIIITIVATRHSPQNVTNNSWSALSPDSPPRQDLAERIVSKTLHAMALPYPYVVFDGLLIRSPHSNTTDTQLDHVVVCQTGIFCIETKSHHGNIYGDDHEYWLQYLGGKRYLINNPVRQNYKHVKALDNLLGPNRRAPVHSYVIFPNAHAVKTSHTTVTNRVADIVSNIECHTMPVYDLDTYERVLRSLVYASEHQTPGMWETHRREVNALVHAKAAEVRRY